MAMHPEPLVNNIFQECNYDLFSKNGQPSTLAGALPVHSQPISSPPSLQPLRPEWGSSHALSLCRGFGIKCLYTNCLSLFNKHTELSMRVSTVKPDIIVLTETWLCLDISDGEIH